MPLKDALINETEDHIKGAAVWALGNMLVVRVLL
jgi:hypothetical protein